MYNYALVLMEPLPLGGLNNYSSDGGGGNGDNSKKYTTNNGDEDDDGMGLKIHLSITVFFMYDVQITMYGNKKPLPPHSSWSCTSPSTRRRLLSLSVPPPFEVVHDRPRQLTIVRESPSRIGLCRF